ncbi:MAG: hypothetical protein KA473_16665 [Anaerolineales bacterium]|nr:hypothetical protein [Anaerolineales bacterium]
MQILLMFHSILRWLVVIVAVAAVIKFALGWLRGGKFSGMDRGLASGFSGLIDLQATLGIIYLVWDGIANSGFPMFRIEHATTMILAAVLAHLPAMWKKAEDRVRFRNLLFVVIGTLVLVYVGVARLPGGWTR